MKRILTTGGAALCVALTAVSSVASAKTVLTVAPWGGMGETDQQKKAIIAAFEASHPDIELNVVHYQMDRTEGMLQMLLAPEKPDVVETYLALFPDVMRGGLAQAAPTDIQKEADGFFYPQVLAPITIGGKLYALPTEYELSALAYNRRLFDDLGIAEPPTTWDDLTKLARKIAAPDASGKPTRTGFEYPGGIGPISAMAYFNMLWSNGGRILTPDGKPDLMSGASQQTVRSVADMVKEGTAKLDWWTDLNAQKGGMAFMETWAKQGVQDALKENFADIRTTLLPHGDGESSSLQYGWGFYVTKWSQHPVEAWTFLRWLEMQTHPETAGYTPAGWAMSTLGSFPTNAEDYRRNASLTADAGWWNGFVQGLDVAKAEPSVPRLTDVEQWVSTEVEPILEGKTTIETGLLAAQTKLQTILDNPGQLGKSQ